MHGRKRAPKGPNPAGEEASRQKAKLYTKLVGSVIALRSAPRADAGPAGVDPPAGTTAAPPQPTAALLLSAKLVELNPEVYTAWNIRREALLELAVTDADGAAKPLQAELTLLERALARNPKSYAAWHHRRWVIGRLAALPGPPPAGAADLAREMDLCGQLLDADERNFHCWNYRGFVAAMAGVPPEEELAFTAAKIAQNFSNYSAWHRRSWALRAAHGTGRASLTHGLESLASGESLPLATLAAEFSLVAQALFTEPRDQSGWLYHRWLISQARGDSGGGGAAVVSGSAAAVALAGELGRVDALLGLEPDSKWALLTRARLLVAAAAESESESAFAEAAAIYKRLESVDPLRAGYYRDAGAKVKSGRA